MSFRDDFYKELGESGVLNQTQDQKEMIEGVLFDIWMKGQLERTGLASFCVIIISNVVGFFLAPESVRPAPRNASNLLNCVAI